MTVIKFKVPVQEILANPSVRATALHSKPGLVERVVRGVSGRTGEVIHDWVTSGKGWSNKINNAYDAGTSYKYDNPTNIVQDFRKATGNNVPVVVTDPDKITVLKYNKTHPQEVSEADLRDLVVGKQQRKQNSYITVPDGSGFTIGGGKGAIQLQGQVHPSTALHEMGHYYQLADPTYNPEAPSYIKKLITPTSSQRFQMETDAWDRMNVPKDEKQRIAALASYELNAHKIRHEAAGALVNAGAVAGGGLLIRRAVKAKRAKAVAAALAKREAQEAQTQKMVLGAGAVGTAGLGAYLLNNRRKGNE